jgi:hypothetical protein
VSAKCAVPDQVSFWASPAGGATIALVGVFLTALLTSVWQVMSRRWQRADQRRQIAIEKGEEIYLQMKNYKDYNFQWFSHCRLLMNGQIDYNKFLDLGIEALKQTPILVGQIYFNLGVHFPELISEWENCMEAVQFTTSIEGRYRNDYRAGVDSSPQLFPELQAAVLIADGHIDRTMQHLIEAVRSNV